MRDDRDVTVIESDSGSGFKWFLLGAAVGAGLGLLPPPKAGERTRSDLARRGRKLRSQAEDAFEDLSDELHTRGRELKETVAEFTDGMVHEGSDGKRKVERAGSTAREEMERRLADARARARAAVGADDVAEDDDDP